MALWQTSGGTPDDRRAEADRLYAMLKPQIDGMTRGESKFVKDCDPDAEKEITPRMIFWLRDLAEKYAL